MSKRPVTEDDNPTWKQLRFTARTSRKMLRAQAEDPKFGARGNGNQD